MNAADVLTRLPTLPALGLRLILAVTLVWSLAGVFVVLLRRSSAAMRHRCWALSVLASLAVPVLIPWLPEIRLGWHQSVRLDVVQGVERSNPRERASTPPVAAADFRAAAANGPGPQRAISGLSRSRTLRDAYAAATPTGGGDSKPASTITSGVLTDSIQSASGDLGEKQVVAIWLIILLAPAVCGLWRLARATHRVRRIVAEATAIDDRASLELLRAIGRRLDWSRRVELRQTRQSGVPFCAGWMSPCIVLPEEWHSWSAEALRAVLAHELSHVIRRDVAWQTAARVACACYWFHPLAWLAAWRMRIEREIACDDGVLRAGEKPTDYAHVLVEFSRRLCARAMAPPTAIAMAAHSRLEARVRAILDSNRYRAAVGRRAARALSLAALVVLIMAVMLSPLPRITLEARAAGAASGPKQTASPEVSLAPPGGELFAAERKGAVQNNSENSSGSSPSNDGAAKVSFIMLQAAPPGSNPSNGRAASGFEPATISGRVVLGTDPKQGVAGARIWGVPQNPKAPYLSAISAADGSFRARCVRLGSRSVVIEAQSADRSLLGIARIGTQDTTVVISIGPTASAHGRLVETPGGKPLPGRRLEYGVPIEANHRNESEENRFALVGGVVTANARGEFMLPHLVPGWMYEIRTAGNLGWVSEVVATLTPRDAGTVELGDVRNAKFPHTVTWVTWEEQIAQSMRHGQRIDDVLRAKLEHARLADQRVLIIAGSPRCKACRRLVSIVLAPLFTVTLLNQTEITQFNGGGPVEMPIMPTTAKVKPAKTNGEELLSAALADFAVVGIDTSDARFAAENRAFFERLKVPFPAPDDALLAVIGVDGRLVGAVAGKDVADETTESNRRLLEFLFRSAPPTPDAEKLLDEALAKAKRENKRVLVRENAARCDPCESLSRYFDKQRPLLDKDYVCVKLDERYGNGHRALARVRDAWEGGVPWMAILDAEGKPLITSDSPHGNIGFPETAQEISYFAWMLRATARDLTEEDVQTLIQSLTPDNSKKNRR